MSWTQCTLDTEWKLQFLDSNGVHLNHTELSTSLHHSRRFRTHIHTQYTDTHSEEKNTRLFSVFHMNKTFQSNCDWRLLPSILHLSQLKCHKMSNDPNTCVRFGSVRFSSLTLSHNAIVYKCEDCVSLCKVTVYNLLVCLTGQCSRETIEYIYKIFSMKCDLLFLIHFLCECLSQSLIHTNRPPARLLHQCALIGKTFLTLNRKSNFNEINGEILIQFDFICPEFKSMII